MCLIIQGTIEGLKIAMQLGIFLCMRCAALHRKLGTHISKVKSLSMDSWSNDQVEVDTRTVRGSAWGWLMCNSEHKADR